MVGAARFSLVSAGIVGAAVLLWVSTRLDETALSGYAGRMTVLAGAGATLGLAITLSATTSTLVQRSRRGAAAAAALFIALAVLAGFWVLLAHAPSGEVTTRVRDWSAAIGVRRIVDDLGQVTSTVAFGVGVLLASLLALLAADRGRAAPPALDTDVEAAGEGEIVPEASVTQAA